MDGEELAAVYCNVSYADVVDAVLQLTMASRLSTAALALLPRCALPRDHGSFEEDHGPRWPQASGWPQGRRSSHTYGGSLWAWFTHGMLIS